MATLSRSYYLNRKNVFSGAAHYECVRYSGGFPALALTALTSCKSPIYFMQPEHSRVLEVTTGDVTLRQAIQGGGVYLMIVS